MKKFLTLFLILAPSLAWADRLGGINTNVQVLLSTQGIQNTNTLQSGATFYVSSGTVKGQLNISPATDLRAIVVTAAPSQTVNLTQWQNPGGVVTARVNAAGEFSNPNPPSGSGVDNERYGLNAGASLTTGQDDTFIGNAAGQNNTTGSNNTAIGVLASLYNTDGSDNLSIGFESLLVNQANINSAIGFEAMLNNLSGTLNMGIGYVALFTNTTGSGNTAIGPFALYSNNSDNNNAIGSQALYLNSSGTGNLGIGYQAGYSGNANTTGSFNSYIGYLAASGAPVGVQIANATAIGANSVVSSSNSVVLGNNANVGIGVSSPISELDVANRLSSQVGAIVQGAAAQSVDLQEWQDSSANVKSTVDKNGIFFAYPRTKTQLSTEVPSAAGGLYFCSDCTVDGIVQSTGTTVGSFAKLSSRTTAIQ